MATKQARALRSQRGKERLQEREMGQLEDAGSAELSKQSTGRSVGGMLGGLGGSMLLKYLASAALTAATGGAAGPAVMAMLTAASHAAPALGSGLGNVIGGAAGQAANTSDRLSNMNFKSKALKGAGHDTAKSISSQLKAQAIKSGMSAAMASALTGGTNKWIGAAKDAGAAQLASETALKELGQGVALDEALKVGTESQMGILDLQKALYNQQNPGLLQKVLNKGKDLVKKNPQAAGGASGGAISGLYNQGVQGVTGAQPGDLDAYKQYLTGGNPYVSFDEWLNTTMNQQAGWQSTPKVGGI